MAFPTIPTAAAGRALTAVQANTTATRTFPNLSSLTKNSGDLLIAIVVAYQSSLTSNIWSSWGAGFTEFHDSGGSSQMCVGIAYKWSTGSETGTFTVTQGGTITGHAAMILLSIPGAHASTPPEAGSRAVGTTSAADPASFNPAGWDAEDTLWIVAAGCGETSTSGAFQGLAGAGGGNPNNYGNNLPTGISADVVGGLEGGAYFRQLNAASEDVGPISPDTSNARNVAVVIAVRPAAAVNITVTPNVASLTTAAFAPTVTATANVRSTPGVASLSTATFAPSVTATAHRTVTPGVAALTLATFAPTVVAANDVTVTPDVASLVLAAFAPTVTATNHQVVTPDPAELTLSGLAPTVTATADVTVTPDTASLSLTGHAPTVTAGAGVTVEPGVASLTLAAFAPSVTVTDNIVVTPDVVALNLTGFGPAVTTSANVVVRPDPAALVLTSYAPTIQGIASSACPHGLCTYCVPHQTRFASRARRTRR